MTLTRQARVLLRRLGAPKGLEYAAAAAMLYHALFITAVVWVKTASNAVFLAGSDPQNLPFLYMGSALVVAGASIALARPLAKYSALVVARRILPVISILVALAAFATTLEVPGSLGLFYLVGESFTTVVSILFWATVSEVFDVRAGKLLIGFIGGMGMAGSIVGGALVQKFSGVFEPIFQAYAAALLLLVAWPLLRTMGRHREYSGTVVPKQVAEKARVSAGLHYASAERYPKLLGALVAMLSVLSAVVDYLFRSHYAQASAEEMNRIFGAYNAHAGVIALIFQIFLTRMLLSRIGLFPFLLLIPAATGIAGLWAMMGTGQDMPIYTLKVVQSIGSFSVTAAGVSLLYNPIPVSVRGSLRALVDGSIKKTGAATAGVLLLILGATLPGLIHPVLVVLLVFVLLILIGILRQDYAEALDRKITGRTRKVDQGRGLWLDDASTRAMLERRLSDPNPETVQEALALLSTTEHDLTERLESLLNHPSEHVRIAAIDWASGRGGDEVWALLVRLVAHEDARRPRAAAARALSQIDAHRAAALLHTLIHQEHVDPALRCAGIEALFASEDHRARGEKIVLGSWDYIQNHNPAHRREFARLLGRLPEGDWSLHLSHLFHDVEPSVVKLAIESAGQVCSDRLIEPLVSTMGRRGHRKEARRALANYGNRITEQAKSWLNDPRLSLQIRQEIPRLLRMIGSHEAANALLKSNPDDDPFLQHRVAMALSRLVHQNPKVSEHLDQKWIHSAIERQIDRLFRCREDGLLLAPDPRFALLHRAVFSRYGQVLDICLRLFSLQGDRELLNDVSRVLIEGSRSIRGDALELLDVSLKHHPLKSALFRELENVDETILPGQAEGIAKRLASGRDRTLAAVAGRCLGLSGLPRPAPDPSILPEDLMSDHLIDRILLFEKAEIFAGLNLDERAAIASLAKIERHHSGQAIYRQGDPSTTLYVLIKGGIDFHRDGSFVGRMESGTSQICFGDIGFLDRKPRPYSATACKSTEFTEIFAVNRQDFMDLVADRIELLDGLFSVLVGQLRTELETVESTRLNLAAVPDDV